MSLEVEGEHAALERRERAAEARDERLELLRRDDATRRILRGSSGKRIAEREVGPLVVPRRGVAERERPVQRRVLVARGGLDRRDDLARDAELGKGPEGRLLLDAVVAHGLVETDEALLHEIIGIATGDEIGRAHV